MVFSKLNSIISGAVVFLCLFINRLLVSFMPIGTTFRSEPPAGVADESKKSQLRRIKQKLRRRERRKMARNNQSDSQQYPVDTSESWLPQSTADTVSFTLDRDPGIVPPLRNPSDNQELWSSLQRLSTRWLDVFRYHGARHSAIRELLLSEGLAKFVGNQIVVGSDSMVTWISGRRSEGALESDSAVKGCLLAVLDQLESNMLSLDIRDNPSPDPETSSSPSPILPSAPPSPVKDREATPPTAEASLVQCIVNGVTMNLRFKNSGNNDLNDIETYLQEKLDVLEFLQMDCSKLDKSSSGPNSPRRAPSKMLAPKLASLPIDSRSVTVDDDVNMPTPMSVSRTRSSSSTKRDPEFFIGTPTSRPMGVNDSAVSSVADSVADDDVDVASESSQLNWETGSVASRGSSRRRNRSTSSVSSSASSRRRSNSVSSVSSASSAGHGWPTRKLGAGALSRGRLSRFALASLSSARPVNDENSFEVDDINTQTAESKAGQRDREYTATGWWN